jgi:hypothetical protein
MINRRGSDATRQAIHRATRRLERIGIVETKIEGRSKYVRYIPSAEEMAAMEEQAREREAFEEAAKDSVKRTLYEIT